MTLEFRNGDYRQLLKNFVRDTLRYDGWVAQEGPLITVLLKELAAEGDAHAQAYLKAHNIE